MTDSALSVDFKTLAPSESGVQCERKMRSAHTRSIPVAHPGSKDVTSQFEAHSFEIIHPVPCQVDLSSFFSSTIRRRSFSPSKILLFFVLSSSKLR